MLGRLAAQAEVEDGGRAGRARARRRALPARASTAAATSRRRRSALERARLDGADDAASSRCSPSCPARRLGAARLPPAGARSCPSCRRCTRCGGCRTRRSRCFERCSYRYYVERVAGLRAERPIGSGETRPGGDRDRRRGAPAARARRPARAGRARRSRSVREWYPTVDRRRARADRRRSSTRYCDSALAQRIAALEDVRPERPFAFEHDGVLLHGRLDVLWRDGGKALVLDYKTNSLAEHEPDEIVEDDYRLQRLVYALACFRAGADEVEVVYAFLERARRRRLDDVRARRDRRRSRPSCRRRSRGSTPASSSRRRASSPAPAARRSTSCAPGRGCRCRRPRSPPAPRSA